VGYISSISPGIEPNNKYQSIIKNSAKPMACQEISKAYYALVYHKTLINPQLGGKSKS